jgi:succinate dehydrogenase/fumarate reductase iron-sulfur protein
MSKKAIKVRILRFTPRVDRTPHYQTYEVPMVPGMSALNILDYIYNNLDSTLAYYSHATCHRGICGRCTLLINSKASLACQTEISEDVTIMPLPKFKVIRDLVYVIT